MEEELLDWELLHGSDSESTHSIASNKKSGSSSVIDDGLDSRNRKLGPITHSNLINLPDSTTDLSQFGLMESGDSSRVDYGSESPNRRRKLGGVPIDLSLDQFRINQSGDDCVRNELGFYDSKTGVSGDGEVMVSDFKAAADENHVEEDLVSELTGGTLSHYEDAGNKCLSESDDLIEHIEDSSKSWSDSGGIELVSGDSGIVSDSGVVSTEAIEASGENTVEVVDVNSGDDESKSREIVWWKMPFVLIKYCTFRIGPVWSVSMVAAVMSLVLLGRRLYNMKKKAQRFHIKVTIDDKKVSRVMSQAAQLNEVFTEVRRVPVIRPALPSPGTWPVLSLR